MIRIFILTLLLFTFSNRSVQAQSWQWGRSISYDSGVAGTRNMAYRINNSGFPLLDMATDEAGNVYSLLLSNTHLKVVGQSVSGYGGWDILLTSFGCDGRYRWSKLIGSTSDSDAAVSVKASVESGVFVTGLMSMAGAGGGHIDNDTTVASTNKTMFLAKWDTSGNFQWLRLPQPTFMNHDSAWSFCRPADMDLGEDGTIYLLACLSPGSYEGGSYVVNNLGAHVLRYSSNGQFLGGVVLPITNQSSYPILYASSLSHSRLRYDGTNNRLIVSGLSGLLGSTSIAGSTLGDNVSFIGSFNTTNGTLGWLKTSNPIRYTPSPSSDIVFYSSSALDARGNVYIVGWAKDSAFFNGVLFRNPWRLPSDFVMKLDASTGQALWTTIGRGGISSDLALTGNKLAITGFYQDSLIYPGGLLTNNPLLDSGDAYIVQLDAATGAVQKIASLTGTSRTSGNLITADRRGNFYVTGSYGLQGQVIGPDALTLSNYYNFFVAKWGWANCSCAPPVASLVHSASSNLAQAYTYTGTTSGLDSLVWDFGDGSTQKITSGFGNAVLHNFATTGHYTVCVTAYNESCGGSSTACMPLALSVGTGVQEGNIQVYPNPVSQELNIEGAALAKAVIYDMLGRQMMQIPILGDRQVLELGTLPAGLYLLRLSDHEGRSQSVKFNKW